MLKDELQEHLFKLAMNEFDLKIGKKTWFYMLRMI